MNASAPGPTVGEEMDAVVARFGLGEVDGPTTERHGGVNRLWRLRTTRGEFAVHALLGLSKDDEAVVRCQRVFDLEVAAAASGVRIAPPIAEFDTGRACALLSGFDGPVVVHRWIDAAVVEIERATPAFYERLGRSLARIHTIGGDPETGSADALARRPTADEWRAVAEVAEGQGRPWARRIGRAAEELAAGIAVVDEWDREADERLVLSHRDLTSQNLLDAEGDPVLIDWEDAGPIGPGAEIGRTALDNVGRADGLDGPRLRAYLAGYAALAPLPAADRNWCSLWVRGLIVYADHCARSCTSGTAPESLRDQQSQVLDIVVDELRRRLGLVDSLVEAFAAARPPG